MSTAPVFAGSGDQAALAARIFDIMSRQAASLGVHAPIRQTLRNLTTYFAGLPTTSDDTATASNESELATRIDAALRANAAIFAREERDGQIIYQTTRHGRPATPPAPDRYLFAQRLHTPAAPYAVVDITDVVTPVRSVLTTVEPTLISQYWLKQARLAVDIVADDTEAGEASAVHAGEADDLVGDEVAPTHAEEVTANDVPPQVPAVGAALPDTMITLANALQIDVRRPVAELMAQYGPTLVSMLRSAIENDPERQIVIFGNQALPSSKLTSFGKNEVRRVADYLRERGEPLLDTQIIADIFYHNPRQADYGPFRFSLNHALRREKEFDFVGVAGAYLWTLKNMPAIGTKRVKPGEMGQFTGYLEEGFDDSTREHDLEAIRQRGEYSHVLTGFEWEYGVLPYSRALAALLPGAILAKQSSAVLRFYWPQHHLTTIAELRFPTGNKGGWLQGLETTFRQVLVPGALITLSRTADPHLFNLRYDEDDEQEDRILSLDETKKTAKFGFTALRFACAVDSSMLLNQAQFGRLRNLKASSMSERRRADLMLEQVFQTIGTPVGTRGAPRYEADESRLYVSLNVLRPASRALLHHLLTTGASYEPGAKPETWIYAPPPMPATDVDADDDEFVDDDE
jgi:hypothetical protein